VRERRVASRRVVDIINARRTHGAWWWRAGPDVSDADDDETLRRWRARDDDARGGEFECDE